MDPNVSQAAAAALDAAFDAPAQPEATPATPAPQAPESNTPAQPAPPVEQGATHVDSQLDIDLSGLDPDLAEKVRQGYLRQSDYTRKTQEIAPLRQFMEQTGGDIETLQQAYALAQALATDPVTVYNRLTSGLQEQGLLEAATPVQDYAVEEESGEEWELPPHIQQELEANRQFREQFTQRERMAAIERVYHDQVAQVRAAHPNYSQDDLNEVNALAFATEGNVVVANQLYQQMRDRWLQQYLASKASVPDSVSSPNLQGHAERPQPVKTIREAGEIVREQFRAQGLL